MGGGSVPSMKVVSDQEETYRSKRMKVFLSTRMKPYRSINQVRTDQPAGTLAGTDRGVD